MCEITIKLSRPLKGLSASSSFSIINPTEDKHVQHKEKCYLHIYILVDNHVAGFQHKLPLLESRDHIHFFLETNITAAKCV